MKIFDKCPVCSSLMVEPLISSIEAGCPNDCCKYFADLDEEIIALFFKINSICRAVFSVNKEDVTFYDLRGKYLFSIEYFEPDFENINKTINKLKNILLVS